MTSQFAKADRPLDPGNWVGLHVLAAYSFGQSCYGPDTLDARIETLCHQFADELLCDEIGVPHISRQKAAELFAEREAQQRAAAEQAELWRVKIAAGSDALQRQVAAIQAAQESREPVVGELIGGEALAVLKEISGDRERQLDAGQRRFQEMAAPSGALSYHPIGDEYDNG